MKILSTDAYSMTVETTERPYDLEQKLKAERFKVVCFPSLTAINRININFENHDKQHLESFLRNLI